MRLRPVLATLLAGWRAQGYRLVAMQSLLENIGASALPRHRVESGTVPGRSGAVTIQGKAVTGASREA
jgi:hypothetical protein